MHTAKKTSNGDLELGLDTIAALCRPVMWISQSCDVSRNNGCLVFHCWWNSLFCHCNISITEIFFTNLLPTSGLNVFCLVFDTITVSLQIWISQCRQIHTMAALCVLPMMKFTHCHWNSLKCSGLSPANDNLQLITVYLTDRAQFLTIFARFIGCDDFRGKNPSNFSLSCCFTVMHCSAIEFHHKTKWRALTAMRWSLWWNSLLFCSKMRFFTIFNAISG